LELARRTVLADPVDSVQGGRFTLEHWPTELRLAWIRRVPPLATCADDDMSIPHPRSRFGLSPAADHLVLERVARLPPDLAREALLELLGPQAARLQAPVRAAAADWLGRVGSLADVPELLVASISAEPDFAGAARSAADRLVGAALRSGEAPAIAELLADLASRHPELPHLRLDAAAAFALAREPGKAAALLRAASPSIGSLAEESMSQLATRTVADVGLACLGECWLSDGATPFRLPRSPFAHEDELHALELRGAFASVLRGGSPPEEHASLLAGAFARAPVDTRRCITNEAWFGSFGPLFGRTLARCEGSIDRWIAGGRAVIAAIEASHDLHGHGILGRAGREEDPANERAAAWCFLTLAESLLEDAADPASARALLAPRRALLAATSSSSNQELAAETALLTARIELYSGDGAAALSAAEDALRIARELMAAASRDRIERIGDGEAPPPLGATLEGRDDASYSGLVARAFATRSSVRGTLLGDVAGAASDLFEAGAAWPWDGSRLLRCATDFARRGRATDARDCLSRVAIRPEHAYDLACVHALLGEADAALRHLEVHLAAGRFTPAARAQEIAYAARDLDLAAIRGDPRFPVK
jgi:hypothetical protein